MANQKLEDELSVALSLNKDILMESAELRAGYNQQDNTWELIVKYNGDFENLKQENVKVEPLIAGYAILTLPESEIGRLSNLSQIEYIEKPKRLFPQIVTSLREACFYPLIQESFQARNRMMGEVDSGDMTTKEGISDEIFFRESISGEIVPGEGILLAIIDSGIDYTLPQFRNLDGSTKIDWIYDQTTGQEYDKYQIDDNLREQRREAEASNSNWSSLTRDATGHGTNVATIAISASPGSHLMIVKLDTNNQQSYPLTTSLMRAVDYVVKKAASLNQPVAINLSFGNTYGAHDGQSLLERFIDNAAEYGRVTLCVGAGNEGASAGHYSGNLERDQLVEFVVGNYEQGLTLQIWKNYADRTNLVIIAPSGQKYQWNVQMSSGMSRQIHLDNTRLILFAGSPQPYQSVEELYIAFESVNGYLASGIWQLQFLPGEIVNGEYRIYMPSQAARSSETQFLRPSPEETITIPATASRVISVGAYNAYYDAYALFSGRGQYRIPTTLAAGLQKPEISAPGVNIQIPLNQRTEVVSGTSYATPFVTGAAACLMSYGIIAGNDPYLYGEKVKAYLIAGARRLSGYDFWPNPIIGWGTLCLRNSFKNENGYDII